MARETGDTLSLSPVFTGELSLFNLTPTPTRHSDEVDGTLNNRVVFRLPLLRSLITATLTPDFVCHSPCRCSPLSSHAARKANKDF
ncbi:hypothetical protein Poly59_23240 [Rubripirellula reticaptiva]|uniref:Uncharacterized protein n=1 Tax=Rubripirellula reticaptiva TaxID=2528013 RepID=A0A5C6F948_9BACT|nr:hypothetical protein Poly59_23240 [Rubripirellula reticaptiva]